MGLLPDQNLQMTEVGHPRVAALGRRGSGSRATLNVHSLLASAFCFVEGASIRTKCFKISSTNNVKLRHFLTFHCISAVLAGEILFGKVLLGINVYLKPVPYC